MRMLSKRRPKAVTIPLGEGEFVNIRPATSFEVDIAAASAAAVLAGLIESGEAAAEALDILGDEFRQADFTTRAWIEAAAQRLTLLELATVCCEGWAGQCGEDGKPIEKPDRGSMALLLRDSVASRKIAEVVNSRVHEEIKEGNGSAASPSGVARAAEATAPDAARKASDAPTAGAAPSADAVPK